MSRAPARISSAATIAMCQVTRLLISEKSSLRLSIHTSPEAFGNHRRSSPFNSGTTQVSQADCSCTVYAICAGGERDELNCSVNDLLPNNRVEVIRPNWVDWPWPAID